MWLTLAPALDVAPRALPCRCVFRPAPTAPNLIHSTGPAATARVSIDDCLACSGCVTSAEAVLVTQQSVAKFQELLADPDYRLHIVTVAPQAIASLAAQFDEPMSTTLAKLRAALHARGVHAVVEASVGSALALQLAAAEFMAGYLAADTGAIAAAKEALASAAGEHGDDSWSASITASPGKLQVLTSPQASAASGQLSTHTVPIQKLPGAGSGPALSLAVSRRRAKLLPAGVHVDYATDAAVAPGIVVDLASGDAVLPDGTFVSGDASGTVRAPVVEAAKLAGLPVGASASGKAERVPPLPVMASACPGWVVYTEKTMPTAIPYLSRVKSPQAIIGTLMKHVLGIAAPAGRVDTLCASQVCHTAIAPCFDRKLEASRKDFYDDESTTRETDCVLSPVELLELLGLQHDTLQQASAAWHALPSYSETSSSIQHTSHVPESCSSTDVWQQCRHAARVPGGSMAAVGAALERALAGSAGGDSCCVHVPSAPDSDGYAEWILRTVARSVYGLNLPAELPWQAVRNAELQEVALCIGPVEVLRVARVTGFRNIQTMLTRLKVCGLCPGRALAVVPCAGGNTRSAAHSFTAQARRLWRLHTQALALSNMFLCPQRGKAPWHYVEVMACPSGCVNGGGLLKPADFAESDDTRSAVPGVKRSMPTEHSSRIQGVAAKLREQPVVQPAEHPGLCWLQAELSDDAMRAVRTVLHTCFHPLPAMADRLAIKW